MTANIYSAAFALTPAWHGLGTVLDHVMTWQEAVKEAQLDWTVSKKPIYWMNGEYHQIQNQAVVVRDSDQSVLGIVGDGYQPIQNEYAFAFVDTLLEAENGAHYESAGALGMGERVWCLARVPHDITIAGTDDLTQCYLLFTTSHDGSMSATCKLTTVRVVCQNTLSAALRGAGAMMRVKHTASAHNRMEQAKKLMAGVGSDVAGLGDKLNLLARREMTKETMLDSLNRIFPPSKKENDGADAVNTRRENLIGEVLANYENNDNNAFPLVKGTAYNLLQAVTRYVDHDRSARLTEDRIAAKYTVEKARAENALFGSGDQLKSLALVSILDSTAKSRERALPKLYMSAPIPSAPVAPVILPPVKDADTDTGASVSDDVLRDALATMPIAGDTELFTLFENGKEVCNERITRTEATKRNQELENGFWIPARPGTIN